MRRALVTGGSGASVRPFPQALALAGCHVVIHANGGSSQAEALAATSPLPAVRPKPSPST